jgi:hypothetical protein
MVKFTAAVSDVSSPTQLTDVAAEIFRDDLDSGHVTVLAEMIAGASSVPGLGVEVAARLEPWFAFAQDAVESSFGDTPLASLIPADDVAYGIVALYLGLEMLTHLNGDREPALKIFADAQRLVALLGSLSAFLPPRTTT